MKSFLQKKTDQLILQELKRHSSINRVDHYPIAQYQAPEAQEAEGDWEDNKYVLMTRSGGRGVNRGRGRGRDDFGRQGYPKFSINQGATAIPQNLRGAPPPPDWRRGRGRGGAPAGAPRGRGTIRPTAQPRFNNQNYQGTQKITYPIGADFRPSASMFGVAPRTCYSCGDPTHRLRDDACFYKETVLQQQSCPACHMGGHLRSQCCGPNQRATQALREHAKNSAGRGGAPPPQRGGRGAAPRGVGRGDGRGLGSPHRQVHQVTEDPNFEKVTDDPFDEYLSELENQDF